jgi:hypothetical protein
MAKKQSKRGPRRQSEVDRADGDEMREFVSEPIDTWRGQPDSVLLVVRDGEQVEAEHLRATALTYVAQAASQCVYANRDVWATDWMDTRPHTRTPDAETFVIVPWSLELAAFLQRVEQRVVLGGELDAAASFAQQASDWSETIEERVQASDPFEWCGFRTASLGDGHVSAFYQRARKKQFRSKKDRFSKGAGRVYCLADVLRWWTHPAHCRRWAEAAMSDWNGGLKSRLEKELHPVGLPILLRRLARFLRQVSA